MKAYTQSSLRTKAVSLGLTYNYDSVWAEHRLNYRGGSEDTCHYTDSATDAWHTLDMMAEQTPKPVAVVPYQKPVRSGIRPQELSDRASMLSEKQRQLQAWEASLW